MQGCVVVDGLKELGIELKHDVNKLVPLLSVAMLIFIPGMLTITDFIIILHRYYKSPMVRLLFA